MLAVNTATLTFKPTSARAFIVPATPGKASKPSKTQVANAVAGTDARDLARVLGRLSIRERQALFAKPLASGLVPVLDAAHRGATSLLAVYASMGAAMGVRSTCGFDAVFTALFQDKERTAKALLGDQRLRRAMLQKEPMLAADIAAMLAAKGPEAIDAVTAGITAMDAERFNSAKSLAIYLINVFAIREPEHLKAVGLTGQGWSSQDMCMQRVRTLLTFAAKPELTPDEQAACLREAALFGESMRLDRRIFSVTQTKNASVAEAALRYECDNILSKLDVQVADGNDNLVALVIPVSTPLHAMYLTLEPAYIGPEQQPGYMIHFDNRGEGNGSHQRVASGQVYPLRTSVPQTPKMRGLLRQLLVDVLRERGKGTIEGVYAGLERFTEGVHAARGASYLDDPRNFDLPTYPQEAGNCTFANADPGLDRRMGPTLANRFRAFEQSNVTERCRAFVEPELLAATIEANETRKQADRDQLASALPVLTAIAA